MDGNVFWNIIAQYNQGTIKVQCILFVLIIFSFVMTLAMKYCWILKTALGIMNIYIAVAYFIAYGTEPIQRYFAFPLFFAIGVLFLYESWRNADDEASHPDSIHIVLFLLYFIYPILSLLLGNSFPRMVTYIMPCPAASISIVAYSLYGRKNRVLLLLLILWGLTGVKSLFFQAYEDIILLICGIYGITVLINDVRSKSMEDT